MGNVYTKSGALARRIYFGATLIFESLYALFRTRILNDGGTFVENELPTISQDAKLVLTPNAYKSGKLYSAVPNDGTGDFTVDRDSTATYIDEDGTIKTALANVPRIEDGAILVEPQSTNLIAYSENFSDTYWGNYGDEAVVSLSSVISPDGVNFAYKISGTSSALIAGYNPDKNLNHVRSIWARTVSGVGQLHLLSFNGNTNNLFNLTDQWQRFEVTNYGITGAENFYVCDFRGSSNITEVLVWGAQAEQASTVSSYIPTDGTTVTRLADNISVPTAAGVTSITETIDGVEQTPITTIPTTYSLPEGNINKVKML